MQLTYKFGSSKSTYQRKTSGADDELNRVKKGD
jgi:hypothetical protein